MRLLQRWFDPRHLSLRLEVVALTHIRTAQWPPFDFAQLKRLFIGMIIVLAPATLTLGAMIAMANSFAASASWVSAVSLPIKVGVLLYSVAFAAISLFRQRECRQVLKQGSFEDRQALLATRRAALDQLND